MDPLQLGNIHTIDFHEPIALSYLTPNRTVILDVAHIRQATIGGRIDDEAQLAGGRNDVDSRAGG
jgi:hypothetical protein